MQWLLNILSKSNIALSLPNNEQRQSTSRYGNASSKPESSRSYLLDLPSELLIEISSHLRLESQVLLSLTCKFFRNLLTEAPNLNLTLTRSTTHFALNNFLRHLSRDHPEYLPCNTCGRMFIWKRRRLSSHGCPRSAFYHRRARSFSWPRCLCFDHGIFLKRELIDLILRHEMLGPAYGLPLSYLRARNICWSSVLRITEGRMKDGRLLVAMKWMAWLTKADNILAKAEMLVPALCLHRLENISRGFWKEWESVLADVVRNSEVVVLKCQFCATDHRISIDGIVNSSNDGDRNIVIESWHDYGGWEVREKASEQIFRWRILSELENEEVDGRDLEAEFMSAEGSKSSLNIGDIHCEH